MKHPRVVWIKVQLNCNPIELSWVQNLLWDVNEGKKQLCQGDPDERCGLWATCPYSGDYSAI